MKEIFGDIFLDAPKDSWIVITTNIGWKKNGENPMGRGIAGRMANIFPEIRKDYGSWCIKNREKIYFWTNSEYGIRVICAPTKPLDVENPHLSWKKKSDMNLIRNSLHQIKEFSLKNPTETVMLPLMGTDNGRLPVKDVVKLIREMNLPDNVILTFRD